jgi:hypothetical protein
MPPGCSAGVMSNGSGLHSTAWFLADTLFRSDVKIRNNRPFCSSHKAVVVVPVQAFRARLQNCEKRLLASSCLSVRSSVRLYFRPNATTQLPQNGVSLNLVLVYFSKIMLRKLKNRWNLTRIPGALHEDLSTLMVRPRSFLLRIRNVWFFTH